MQCYHFERLVFILGKHSHYFLNSSSSFYEYYEKILQYLLKIRSIIIQNRARLPASEWELANPFTDLLYTWKVVKKKYKSYETPCISVSFIMKFENFHGIEFPKGSFCFLAFFPSKMGAGFPPRVMPRVSCWLKYITCTPLPCISHGWIRKTDSSPALRNLKIQIYSETFYEWSRSVGSVTHQIQPNMNYNS